MLVYKATYSQFPQVVIEADPPNKTLNVTVYGEIWFLPEFTIATGSGNFTDGITLSFNLDSIITGSFKFYIEGGWIWLHFDVKVFGADWKGDIKLVQPN